MRRYLARVLLVTCVASALGTGCGDADLSLSVDLRTDFIAGVEFGRTRATLRSGDVVERQDDMDARFGDVFADGRRIAELRGLAPGARTLHVALLDMRGRQVVDRTVNVALTQTTAVTVLLTRSCLDVDCPSGGAPPDATSCLGGRCVTPDCTGGAGTGCGAPSCTSEADCTVSARCARGLCLDGACFAVPVAGICGSREFCHPVDGCVALPSPDPDAGPPACRTDAECDDSVDCTVDRCDSASGRCELTPDDTRCAAGPGGSCSFGFGCTYPGCSSATCTPGPCETAQCEGTTCMRAPTCTVGQVCCAGSCAPSGCDDGNPCTADTCGATGCMNVPASGPCDDGSFCNGPDMCEGGACTDHLGSPCLGSTVCIEAMRACEGCAVDADCPAPITGTYGPCGGFSGTCGTAGMRTRSVTTFRCLAGTCMGSAADQMTSCSRVTDGDVCSATTTTPWGTCSGFTSTCDLSGIASRTRTDFRCAAGACAGGGTMETQACMRSTDGTMCGSPMLTAWGSCTGFSDDCDQTGTQSRMRTDPICASGTCSGSMMSTEMQPCSRLTNGDACEDWPSCRRGTCSSGSCALVGSACGAPRICCEPGICISSGTECP